MKKTNSREYKRLKTNYLPGRIMSIWTGLISLLIIENKYATDNLRQWQAIMLETNIKVIIIITIYRILSGTTDRIYTSLA